MFYLHWVTWESVLEDMAVKLPFEGHVGFSQIKGVWEKSDPSRGNSWCKGRRGTGRNPGFGVQLISSSCDTSLPCVETWV